MENKRRRCEGIDTEIGSCRERERGVEGLKMQRDGRELRKRKRTQEGEGSESKDLSSRVWKNDRKEKISEILRNTRDVQKNRL
jgi:hypothetical protein